MTIISKEIYELPQEELVIRICRSNAELEECSSIALHERKRVGIVLPTYMERENLQMLIPVLQEIFARHEIDGYLFIVDDNSPDDTAGIAMEFAKVYPNITVIQRPGKMGLGSAYVLGFKHALDLGVDYVFMMDSDLSHRPSYIPKFLRAMDKTNAGLVIGSRYCKGGGTMNWPARRRLISNGANLLARVALGIKQTRDMTSGFRCFKASTLQNINYSSVESNGYSFIGELLFRAKHVKTRIHEIPIVFYEREIGESKLGKSEIKEFIIFITRSIISRARRMLTPGRTRF